MHDDEVEVDEALVRRLVAAQMSDLAEWPLAKVEPWGTDNAIWRLGDDLVVRLPRIHWATKQIVLASIGVRRAPAIPPLMCRSCGRRYSPMTLVAHSSTSSVSTLPRSLAAVAPQSTRRAPRCRTTCTPTR